MAVQRTWNRTPQLLAYTHTGKFRPNSDPHLDDFRSVHPAVIPWYSGPYAHSKSQAQFRPTSRRLSIIYPAVGISSARGENECVVDVVPPASCSKEHFLLPLFMSGFYHKAKAVVRRKRIARVSKVKRLIILQVYCSLRIEGNPPTSDVLKSIIRRILADKGWNCPCIPEHWVLGELDWPPCSLHFCLFERTSKQKALYTVHFNLNTMDLWPTSHNRYDMAFYKPDWLGEVVI
ncbi:hypothetical protein BT96DRAFT_1007758 [Gymnopus androsaceus JB14]|uniref:Uncharacterized protein n=1 Tax=Gymnopus androsaceus JB14 TaxID=1447944 RepID=A0A6A4GGR8_9AGAR|nr:hypothetical protein BT96DRAFT_1007758 [Gymnopus androsaceus JB14]